MVLLHFMANVIYMLCNFNSTDFTTQVYVTQAYLCSDYNSLRCYIRQVIYLWHKFNQRVKIDIRIVIFLCTLYLSVFSHDCIHIYISDISCGFKSKIVIEYCFYCCSCCFVYYLYSVSEKMRSTKKTCSN